MIYGPKYTWALKCHLTTSEGSQTEWYTTCARCGTFVNCYFLLYRHSSIFLFPGTNSNTTL